MNETPMTPQENLVTAGYTAVGTIVGILVGMKQKHPVIGFVIGSAVGSVIGLAHVVVYRKDVSRSSVATNPAGPRAQG